MDATRFDALTRLLGGRTRRHALAAFLASTLGLAGLAESPARKGKGKKKKKKKTCARPRDVRGQGKKKRRKCPAAGCLGCKEDGFCHPGTADDRCGAGGDTCQNCTAQGNYCRDHQCRDCNPEKCAELDGCCVADGGCAAGTSPDACGSAGQECQFCFSDERCEANPNLFGWRTCCATEGHSCHELRPCCQGEGDCMIPSGGGPLDKICCKGGSCEASCNPPCAADRRCCNGVCVSRLFACAGCGQPCPDGADRCVDGHCQCGDEPPCDCTQGAVCVEGKCVCNAFPGRKLCPAGPDPCAFYQAFIGESCSNNDPSPCECPEENATHFGYCPV